MRLLEGSHIFYGAKFMNVPIEMTIIDEIFKKVNSKIQFEYIKPTHHIQTYATIHIWGNIYLSAFIQKGSVFIYESGAMPPTHEYEYCLSDPDCLTKAANKINALYEAAMRRLLESGCIG